MHVTPNFEPSEESKLSRIWLLAVTAVVSTVTEVEPDGTATLPAAAEPQAAGEALELQFVPVPSVAGARAPVMSVVLLVPLFV